MVIKVEATMIVSHLKQLLVWLLNDNIIYEMFSGEG